MLHTFRSHHLLFDFSFPVADGEATQLLEPLNRHILSHFDAHGIGFTSPPALSSHTDSFLYEKASCQWILLELGKLSQDRMKALLKVAKVTTWGITSSNLTALRESTARIMSNPESPTPQLLFMGRLRLGF